MIRKMYNEKKSFDPESSSLMLNPRPFLEKLINERVSMRVMSGAVFEGTLVEISPRCNLRLTDVKEFVFGREVNSYASLQLYRFRIMYVRKIETPGGAKGASKDGGAGEPDFEPAMTEL